MGYKWQAEVVSRQKNEDLDLLRRGILVHLEKFIIVCDLLGLGFSCSHGGAGKVRTIAHCPFVTVNGMADFLKLGSSTSPTGPYTLGRIAISLPLFQIWRLERRPLNSR